MANFIFDATRLKLQTGDIDLNTDTFKILLVTSTYSPNQATHDFRDDVTNEVTGTGYTAGGATLASVTVATTAANSWASTWAASTAYTVGQVRRPTTGNGFLYRAITAGTSAASEPTWPTTKGDTVTDSGTKWQNIGAGVTVFDAADPSWASSTITARAGVVYKSRGGAATADELVAYLDFVSDVTSTAATFTVTLPVEGIAYSWSY